MNVCRSCDAPIRWARTEKNDALIPLDFEPWPEGNTILVAGKARVLGPLDILLIDPAVERFMPHHATCPNADDWRTR